ncbi:hypothetical protein [Bradyrhizobium sp. Leo121]|uniref:hypothetical protein n=1 Tax=Bradyrhizobium sp. Leo121 TaxID=1571195 RepID=UPI0013EF2F41|nr:hypothetical protein [Bradyrhizobium sp. Leo121]
MDTEHVGAASENLADVTQRIATIVTYAQAARHFLDHRPLDLDEVRQALDCIVREGFLASDVIYRIRASTSLPRPESPWITEGDDRERVSVPQQGHGVRQRAAGEAASVQQIPMRRSA